MNELIALLIALVVHEFGHYIHYFILGFKPKVKWLGIGPCIDPEVKDIAIKHVIVNIFIAVTLGVITLRVLEVSNIALFAYFVGCFMDLNNAQMLLIYLYRKTLSPDSSIDSIKVVIRNKIVT